MVRGDARCPKLCKKCRIDCSCKADGCGLCHTCRDKPLRTQQCRDSWHEACVSFQHDCHDYLSGTKEDRISRKMAGFPTLFVKDLVRILVGTETAGVVERLVPSDLLIENSQYFRSYFSFHEKAGSSGSTADASIELATDVDRIEAFDMFMQFIYWNDYCVPVSASPACQKADDLFLHTRVYVLAERLQTPELKQFSLKRATQLCYEFSKNPPDKDFDLENLPEIIDIVYSNTCDPQEPGLHPKDPFRNLIASFSACFLQELRTKLSFVDRIRAFPEFSIDLLGHLNNRSGLELDKDGYLTK